MTMASFFSHSTALVETSKIGKNTRVWAYAHILPSASIGEECNICDHVFIENDVTVGNRVTIKCGVQLWDGITVEDDVFIGPNATFTNDMFPRSKKYPDAFLRTVIHKGASIGANATILPGLEIGQFAMVGAGAVVTKNVPPYAIVVGNPARIKGYVQDEKSQTIQPGLGNGPQDKNLDSSVAGVQLYKLPVVIDLRGNLTFAEFEKTLPFDPKRFFLVFDVPSKEIRGEHAHRRCHQFLICIKGNCSIVVDNGKCRQEFLLDRPNLGLHISPMIWATEYKYSADSVLLVLASDPYDADDYIRDYDTFLHELNDR